MMLPAVKEKIRVQFTSSGKDNHLNEISLECIMFHATVKTQKQFITWENCVHVCEEILWRDKSQSFHSKVYVGE